MFPLITNTASQLFVIFLGLVLAYWLACDYPRMHHEVCTIIGQEKETSYRFMVAILSRSVGGYMRGMVVTSIVRWHPRLYRLYAHWPSLRGTHGHLYRHHALGPGCRSLGKRGDRTVLGFMFSPMLALWTLVVTMVAQNVTDNGISPKVMQSSVQVHPIMSLTALVIGSALMGPIGMVIAIPLCAALKGIFVYYFENETGRQLVAYDGAVFKGTPYRDAEATRSPPTTRLETIRSFTSPSSSATRPRPRPRRCPSPSSRIPGSSSRACSPMRRAFSRIPSPRTMTPTRTTIPKPASTAPWTIRIPNRHR